MPIILRKIPANFYVLFQRMREMRKDHLYLIPKHSVDMYSLNNPYRMNIGNTLFLEKFNDDVRIDVLFISGYDYFPSIYNAQIGNIDFMGNPRLTPRDVERIILAQRIFPVKSSTKKKNGCEITFKAEFSPRDFMKAFIAHVNIRSDYLDDDCS